MWTWLHFSKFGVFCILCAGKRLKINICSTIFNHKLSFYFMSRTTHWSINFYELSISSKSLFDKFCKVFPTVTSLSKAYSIDCKVEPLILILKWFWRRDPSLLITIIKKLLFKMIFDNFDMTILLFWALMQDRLHKFCNFVLAQWSKNLIHYN